MFIERLQLDFLLPGCRSLKEKRQRLARLRDKFGRITNLAVCESGFQDRHDRAQWTFVAVGGDYVKINRTLEDVASYADQFLDALVVDVDREAIA